MHALHDISDFVSSRDAHLWLGEAYPVILIVYDGQRDRTHWLHVQEYFAAHPTADLFLAGQTVNVHLPVSRGLERRSVQRIVERKNAIHTQFLGRDRPDA